VKRADYVKKSGEQPIYCNCCGKELKTENGIQKEDAFEASKEWGYFSNKDMEVHCFILCEDCYDHLISQFKIPVQISNKTEAL